METGRNQYPLNPETGRIEHPLPGNRQNRVSTTRKPAESSIHYPETGRIEYPLPRNRQNRVSTTRKPTESSIHYVETDKNEQPLTSWKPLEVEYAVILAGKRQKRTLINYHCMNTRVFFFFCLLVFFKSCSSFKTNLALSLAPFLH